MKVAVVGAGISGLGAAWLLAQKHEVHVFEAAHRLGGHAHTVQIAEDSKNIPVDTGFLVYNELTYPHLTAFFKFLGVETTDSDMSLSIQVKHKNLEWAGNNLNTIFGQRRNLIKPRFYRMLSEIMKFADDADENLRLSRAHSWTLADLLEQKKLSYEFCHDYLLPIGAAIWSTPEKHMLDFPAETFLVFFMNHKLLQVNNRPVWKTVKNGSINYIQKIAQQLRHVHLNAPVESVERRDGRVHVKTTTESLVFDKVVLATHAPITSKILKAQSDLESQILSPFYYTENQTLLHADSSFMPQRKRCWSSWNVIGATEKSGPQNVCLSYYLNKLQPLKTKNDYFVTLNPIRQVQKVIQEFSYSHPQFDQKAIQAQNKLPVIQGNGGVYFAGAWSRYGFHEDGLLSAVRVAQQFDIQVPWSID